MMVLPGWIGNQGDAVEGGRSAEALVWEQWPLLLLGGCFVQEVLIARGCVNLTL